MNELLAVAAITLLAVISPGADFAMITRNSYLYGRRAGVWTATGIACGVWVHVGYTLLGVSVLFSQMPWLFHGIKVLGAGYLMWIGWQTMRQAPVAVVLGGEQGSLGVWQAWQNGFLTNALNAKSTLFVLSTFTQIVHQTTPLAVQLAYGALMSGAPWLWFAAVALLLSKPALRNRLLARQQMVNRIIGILLLGLGLLLLVAAAA